MSIEEIALRLIESDCSTDYYFKILDELGNNTTKIQELEKEKLHIEIAYEEDYKEQHQEIERLGNELQVQIEDNTRLNEYIEAQDKKLQQKENIIKEVREYAKDNQFTAHLNIQTNKVTKIENGEMTDILEILDKVEE